MGVTRAKLDGTEVAPPARGGLFWTTFVLLVLSVILFAAWFVLLVVDRVGDEFLRYEDLYNFLGETGFKLVDILYSTPFAVAYLLIPVISVSLLLVWGARQWTGFRIVGFDGSILLGMAGLWGWFSTMQLPFGTNWSTETDLYGFRSFHTLGLPWNPYMRVQIICIAAGMAYLVILLVRMLRRTVAIHIEGVPWDERPLAGESELIIKQAAPDDPKKQMKLRRKTWHKIASKDLDNPLN